MAREGGTGRLFAAVYGLAHFGKSLLWHGGELLFAYFLTEICGLPGTQMGQILGLSLVINAIADLCIGRALSGLVTSIPTAAKVQLVGAVLSGTAFVAVAFTGHVDPAMRFSYALCAVLAFRVTYSFFDTPQNTILLFSTSNDSERAGLSSTRYVFAGLAKIALAASFAPLLQGRHPDEQAVRFTWMAVVLVTVAIVTSIGLYLLSRRDTPQAAKIALGKSVEGKGASGQSLRIFPMVVATAIGFSIFTKLEPYFATFVLQSRLDGGVMMIGIAVGAVLGQPIWLWVARRCGLVNTLQAAAALVVVGLAGFVVFAKADTALIAVVSALYGVGFGGVGMCQWALLASIGSNGTRFFSGTAAVGLFTCCSKLGKAAAVLGLGAILDRSAYREASSALEPVFLFMLGAPLVGVAFMLLLSLTLAPGLDGRRRLRQIDV